MTIQVKIPMMQPTTECKVCKGKSLLYGVIDFTKNCHEPRVKVQVSGIPIYYYQCQECDFLFTRAFDDWDIESFNTHIYNENYHLFDPDYAESRPAHTASQLQMVFDEYPNREEISGLDYGGGNGHMAHLMCAQGYDFISWDPINSNDGIAPDRQFNLVTATEVAEHVPDPQSFFSIIAKYLAADGIGFISTCPIDLSDQENLLQWWYVGPLNGHISIYSNKSLDIIAKQYGFNIIHNGVLHIIYRTPGRLAQFGLEKIGVQSVN